MNSSSISKPVVSAPPSSIKYITLKADTGATTHFLDSNDIGNLELHNPTKSTPAIEAIAAFGSPTQSSKHTYLPIPSIPPSEATLAHTFPSLASGSLLSIGKLSDAKCTTIFDSNSVKVYRNNDVSITPSQPPILTGTRNPSLGEKLYSIKLPTKSAHSAQATYHQPSIRNRVAFYHAAMFSPVIATWIKAVQSQYLHSWPSLTTKQISKYGPLSLATIRGHQHAHRSNIQSSKSNHRGPLPLTYAAAAANVQETKPDPTSLRTGNIFIDCEEITGRTFSDLTGRFVCPSISGNNYILIVYDYDSNSIHPVAIPSRKKHDILTAFQSVVSMLKRKGFKPKLHRLDNEISKVMEEYMESENISFQLTPTGLHRRNLAERAIQTYKNHFISGLCSTHPDFPLMLWDKLLPQSAITLNLLRPSRVNPQLSAYAQLNGPFNYNATPMAPPGMKVQVHERPESRGSTWATHDVDGWYIGPSMKHYRQHRVWIPSTSSERIADTVTWLPHNIHMPTSSATDIIIAAANDLTQALLQQDKSPLLPPPGTKTREALKRLQEIFSNRVASLTPPVPYTEQVSTDADLPRVSLPTASPKKPANIPRVPLPSASPAQPTNLPRVPTSSTPPSTTSDLISLSNTIKAARRRTKKSTTPSSSSSPPSSSTSTSSDPPRRRSTQTRKSNPKYVNNLDFTMAPLLPTAVRGLIQREATRTASPTTSSFQRLNAVLDPTTGKLLEYKDLLKTDQRDIWYDACSKEFARLCNGRSKDSTKGTNTIAFKKPSELPKGKKATYLRICANYRPQKADPYRIRFTVGGNLVDYKGDTYTPTSDLTTAKILFNSVLSTGIDLANFYLITPFESPDDYEYMMIPYWAFPEDIKKEYNIDELVENNQVLAVIQTGMYGLPQAGRLAYNKLARHLADAGYYPTKFTPGLFKHKDRPIIFSLVVDDFGVKYIHKQDVEHLIAALEPHYDLTTDWEGEIFCGLHLKWDYDNRTVTCSMPGYVIKALKRFGHPTPSRPQHSPHKWNRPRYGCPQQYAESIVKNANLTKEQKKYCQEVIGVFLYYGRAVDNTILVTVGTIATHLSTATWPDLQQRINQLLDYMATHPNAAIRFHASDMHLWVHTDSSYLNEPKSRSRGGGYFYLSDKPNLPIKATDSPPRLNAPIQVNSKVIDAVMSSAQEAETGSGFNNAKDACPMRVTLDEMSHPQGPTPLQFDNNTATGILTDTMSQRRSKAMDMRFYWLRDRVRQKQFHVYWRKGDMNLADYYTKHFPAEHHQQVRPTYVLNSIRHITSKIRSCLQSKRASHCKGVLKPNYRYKPLGLTSVCVSRPSDTRRVSMAPYGIP